MASRLTSASVVAFFVLVSACTDVATEATTPPNVFASTPRIEDPSPRTTTTLQRAPETTENIDRAVIYPVDPLTLESLPGYAPMPMRDWVWGNPSNDGTYFAAAVGDDQSIVNEIRLINVPAWQQEGSWRAFTSSEMEVTDDGRVYYIENGGLRHLEVGLDSAEVVAQLPPGFQAWGPGSLMGERFLTFGSPDLGTGALGPASVVIADLTLGTSTTIDLPHVRIGALQPQGDEPWAGYLYASPGSVFDPTNSRVLVIHADQDTISEIDIETGAVTDHVLPAGTTDGNQLSPLSILLRSVALTPDGAKLYLASQRGEVVVDGDAWSYTLTPLGVVTIDTTTWEISARLDEPIGEIYLAPDAETALAWGYSSTEDGSSWEMTSFGLHVLDTMPLQVMAHHPATTVDQWYGPFSFNQIAGVGYVSTWTDQSRVHAIDMGTGQIVASKEAMDLQMFGSIGVMSTNS